MEKYICCFMLLFFGLFMTITGKDTDELSPVKENSQTKSVDMSENLNVRDEKTVKEIKERLTGWKGHKRRTLIHRFRAPFRRFRKAFYQPPPSPMAKKQSRQETLEEYFKDAEVENGLNTGSICFVIVVCFFAATCLIVRVKLWPKSFRRKLTPKSENTEGSGV